MSSPLFAPPLIGVFDSGLGGLSVLRALRQRLPQARLLYIADSAYAPYGERPDVEVIDRSEHLTDKLLAAGAESVVVACNTATALAIDHLRLRHAGLPFIGVEPGIKPAVAQSRNQRIGVLATPATVASARFKSLIDRHAAGADVILQPCPGLAAAIEQHPPDSREVRALLHDFCSPLQAARVDTVVLGCTHYPLVAQTIQDLMGPQVLLIDTAKAIAERAATLYPATVGGHAGSLRLLTSGDPRLLEQQAARWLNLHQPAQPLSQPS